MNQNKFVLWKRLPVCLLPVILAWLASGCLADRPGIAPVTTPTPSQAASAAALALQSAAPADLLQDGMDLMGSEAIGGIKIGMTENELSDILGQPESKTAPEEWGADGRMHTGWMYQAGALSVNLTGSDTGYTVYSVLAVPPCALKTARGIGAGDTKSVVLSVYADAIEDRSEEATQERIVAGTVYGGLVFTLDGDIVKSVFLGAAAE